MCGKQLVHMFFILGVAVFRESVDARVFDSGRISRAVRSATSSWQSGTYSQLDGLDIEEIKHNYLGVRDDAVQDSVNESLDNLSKYFSGNSSFDWRDTNQSVCIGPIKVCA